MVAIATVAASRRHLPAHPCLVCGGHALIPKGKGARCWGYLSGDGLYEHCVRPEHAGSITLHKDETYPHRLGAPCRCGRTHDPANIPTPVLSEAEVRRESESRAEGARRLWMRGQDPKGSPVERYLQGRGLTMPIPPSIRFVRALNHRPSGERWPAMVSAVTRWPSREVVAIHRAYLTPEGRKADVDPQRMMLGQVAGGAVRLANAGPVLVVTEGIETGLSVQMANPELPVWAALSTVGLRLLVLPPVDVVREVIIAADRDQDGIAAAHRAAHRWRLEGRRVRVALPPAGFGDFNDVLRGTAAA